jgi:hypothetical protein
MCTVSTYVSEMNAEPVFVEESILPGWESIPGLLERFTNTGSGSPRSIRSVFSGLIKKEKLLLAV